MPDKHTTDCYYLDPSAVTERTVDDGKHINLAAIPHVPKGRD